MLLEACLKKRSHVADDIGSDVTNTCMKSKALQAFISNHRNMTTDLHQMEAPAAALQDEGYLSSNRDHPTHTVTNTHMTLMTSKESNNRV